MGLAPVTEQGYWDGSVAVKGWAVTTVGTGRAPLRARCWPHSISAVTYACRRV